MNFGLLALDAMLKTKDKVALVRPITSGLIKFSVNNDVMIIRNVCLLKVNGLTDEQTTFGELAQLVVNTAASLIRLGVKRDEVVAVCSENRTEFLITAIAGWCSGASVTFLNAAYGKSKFNHVC